MKCYIILYSQDGYFLTFTKRGFSYFSNDFNEIYTKGHSIDEGANQFAFPGGMLSNKKEPFNDCLRKFIEGCGKEIIFEFFPSKPQTLVNLRRMIVHDTSCEILLGFIDTLVNQYHVLYLEFSTVDLRQIHARITNTNFVHADRARIGIYNDVIQNHTQIFTYHPFCPLNDELCNPELWQIEEKVEEIKLLRESQTTNKYYNMIEYLANDILNANISY